jgi:DNA-binding transcriptional LysR family regulator
MLRQRPERSLASAIKSGEVGSLRLALSQTIDPSLVMPHVVELGKLFKGLELKLYRGDSAEVLAYLKRGDAELGLGVDLGDEWERLDSWPLFTEEFQIVVNSMHRLANATSIALGDLKEERFVLRTYCESTPMVLDFLRAQDVNVERRHETGAESDLIALLEAGVGVALQPSISMAWPARSAPRSPPH